MNSPPESKDNEKVSRDDEKFKLCSSFRYFHHEIQLTINFPMMQRVKMEINLLLPKYFNICELVILVKKHYRDPQAGTTY